MSDQKLAFLLYIRDCVAKLFYYDRKGDEWLTCDEVEALINSETISLREVVETFQDEIIKQYPNIKK